MLPADVWSNVIPSDAQLLSILVLCLAVGLLSCICGLIALFANQAFARSRVFTKWEQPPDHVVHLAHRRASVKRREYLVNHVHDPRRS